INSYAEMMEEVSYFYPGDTVSVTLLRDGKEMVKQLTLLNSKGTTEIIRK
ncbi:MAG: deoxyribonuclease HsdR, partial [Bacteroidales bacterium]|nr:deoxyribonuclease HsdR [Bacteroidales bacterium]